MIIFIIMSKYHTRMSIQQKNFTISNSSKKSNKTLLWYGTCIDCCKQNDTIPEKLNKVICVDCGTKLAIADISDEVSVIDKTVKDEDIEKGMEIDVPNNAKCRLCLTIIKAEAYPIWGNSELNYSEKIYLCCSINVSEDDHLPNNLCKDCVLQLDNAFKFRTQCLKTNADINNLNLYLKEEYETDREMKEDLNNSYQDLNTDFNDDDFCDDYEDVFDNEKVYLSEFTCTKCPMVCSTEKEFNIHRDSHCVGKKMFNANVPKIICQVDGCKKEFSKFKDRERHENSHHKDKCKIYNYICPYCAQLVKRLRTFNYHAFYLHSGEEVICNKCGKLMNREMLKRHNRKVHSQETVTCPECGLCINKYSFSRHIKQVHNEKDKLNCQFCSKKFANRWNLQTHVRTHTGEMPYSCPDCGLAFCHRVTMKNHRLHVHNIDMFDKKEGKKAASRRKTAIETF